MFAKVLHLRSSAAFLGAESVIIEIAKCSPEFGFQSIIGGIKDDKDSYPEFLSIAHKMNIETVLFDGKGRIDFTRAQKIRNYINKNHIKILHCHGYKEDFYGIISLTRIPKIATNHLWKIPSTHIWKIRNIRARIYPILDALFLRFFDKVIGVSIEIVDKMNRYGIKNTIVIPNGVDTTKYDMRPKSFELLTKFGFDKENIIVGMISSLSEEKGHKYAIEAFHCIKSDFPHVKLLIIGDGLPGLEEYEIGIKRRVKALGLDNNVVFAGKQIDIPHILSIIDIFLLPSLQEGLPMALLEAMSSGKAVIATHVGEIANVIKHYNSGILIAPSNINELKNAILNLLSNKEYITTLGRAARETVVNRYSSKIMTQRYCEIYSSFINTDDVLSVKNN
jgi:glycosyltransferase involved in cell wall biosynthesis